ncbi:hypothetical protein [Streptomyces sp. NPDC002758]
MTEQTEELKCLEDHTGQCSGPVEFREPLSGTGQSFPRCAAHWSKRLEKQEEIRSRYPDSSSAPDWFDPTYAGERWDEDY